MKNRQIDTILFFQRNITRNLQGVSNGELINENKKTLTRDLSLKQKHHSKVNKLLPSV